MAPRHGCAGKCAPARAGNGLAYARVGNVLVNARAGNGLANARSDNGLSNARVPLARVARQIARQVSIT
ncbi:hypothetical protein [Streptomyces diastatochromogenes]|uniref:hypothetical protein n=1 Tax=Streptomyces diastatochromogenes TaxID=42236 RepID=UPI001180620B|nr:hypothetical protein [Streptomyces diastatochromogenes]